jgi:hypothetical protein
MLTLTPMHRPTIATFGFTLEADPADTPSGGLPTE